MKITNQHRTDTLNFLVKGNPKDGVPPTDSIGPGETKDIDLRDNESAEVKGMIIAGLIRVPASEAKRLGVPQAEENEEGVAANRGARKAAETA
jgi:hypothetical protein